MTGEATPSFLERRSGGGRVDDATGLMLDARRMGLVRVDPDEPVDASTFSTSAPEGAEVVER